MAPEVLGKDYTSKCDMWSMGVVVFVLLLGYMPFGRGISDAEMAERIQSGNYAKDGSSWANLTVGARSFLESLLVVDPDARLSAPAALAHEWLANRVSSECYDPLDSAVVSSLCEFAKASQFKRICLSAMAWSVSSEEVAKVRSAFLEIDKDHTGTITLNELKSVL